MPRFKRFQNSFLGGEIDPEYIMRGDAETANQSCRKARNIALLTGGGAVRRPGTRLLAYSTAYKRYTFFTNNAGTTYALGLENGQARLINATTGALITSVSAPWALADIDDAVFVNGDGGVFVFSSAFMPQFVSYEGGTLTVANFAFSTGVEGVTQQPYYRYAPAGVTMQVAATTGTGVAVTFSANTLLTGHVGTIFRIAGREVLIASRTNGTTGTVDILQPLYPTLTVPMANTSGFKIGQIVEGSETKYRGEVVGITASTSLTVLMLNSFVGFYYDTTDPTLSEKVVGPTGEEIVSGASSSTTSAPALNWDEQMISAARGYPATATIHRNRLVMAGFPNARRQIAASKVGSYYNYDTRTFDISGPSPSDAFIEGIGIDDIRIKHLASLENFLVLTDKGIFYVPEIDTEFAPGEVSFTRIGPEGASNAQPAVVTEGLIYIDVSGGKVMAVIPTGLVGRPWEIRELSQAASHLLVSPKAVVAASTVAARRHRMVFVLNSDGTVAVLSYQRFETFAGWALWSRQGANFESIAVNQSDVWVAFSRGSDNPRCRLDWSAVLDEEVDYSTAAAAHAGLAVTLAQGSNFAATGTLDGSGNFPNVTPAAGYSVGFDFTVELEPFPPYDVERGRNPTGISVVWAHVYASGGFKLNGEYWSPYRPQDSLFDPPPARTGDVEFHLYDEYADSFLKAPSITQTECAPLQVQALTMQGRF